MPQHKLITDAIRAKLLENGQKSLEDGGADHVPVCKFFTPAADCTWLVTEMDPENPDVLSGLADLGMGCPELGSFSLSEISQPVSASMIDFGEAGKFKVPPLPLERDLYWSPKGVPISMFARVARTKSRIVDNPDEVRAIDAELPKEEQG